MSLGEGSLVLDVRDEFCPWNEARWQVESRLGLAHDRERPTSRSTSPRSAPPTWAASRSRGLALAGRVEELQPGAIARADAIFGTARQPWCPELF